MRFPRPARHTQSTVFCTGNPEPNCILAVEYGLLSHMFPVWWVQPRLLSQDTVQIGNQLPGLKMRSLIVGGVSEDKVSVRQGFRGCMQVWPIAGRPPLRGWLGGCHHCGWRHWSTC